jgi:hypothetical protein
MAIKLIQTGINILFVNHSMIKKTLTPALSDAG